MGNGRGRRGVRAFAARSFLAELVDPTGERFLAGGFHIDELDAHSDSWLDNAHHRKSFDPLSSTRQRHPRARLQRQWLAGADEAAPEGNIAGDAVRLRAGLQIDELGVRGKRIANSVATITHTRLLREAFIDATVHGDDVAHRR